ncbi:hypothetical protein G7048_26935 (plasmid) [Diaphorobacter sp. HDW4B]|uniref:hypothetical protein n=1 Tax=Diaphorobacter sp. HDW4B TaxID=2714925 RepID=UPI00140E3875|nr:hypothetical protein [Diaphorobacter sp. HDW4B]QIL74118.1 hypothetical protein G7048_26935 [Diaphorobacter sp. HDW4B]
MNEIRNRQGKHFIDFTAINYIYPPDQYFSSRAKFFSFRDIHGKPLDRESPSQAHAERPSEYLQPVEFIDKTSAPNMTASGNKASTEARPFDPRHADSVSRQLILHTFKLESNDAKAH